MRAILRDFKDAIEPEDVFLLNDPYTAGGNHLPDWVIARPVFVAGKLVAFACNRAHQADIGGGAAGTYNSAATEIFHEGIRLPVLKLIEGGSTRDDLWRLLMINTRLPEALGRRPARHDRLDPHRRRAAGGCWSRSWASSARRRFLRGRAGPCRPPLPRLHRPPGQGRVARRGAGRQRLLRADRRQDRRHPDGEGPTA